MALKKNEKENKNPFHFATNKKVLIIMIIIYRKFTIYCAHFFIISRNQFNPQNSVQPN
jgi:hypothetical protein